VTFRPARSTQVNRARSHYAGMRLKGFSQLTALVSTQAHYPQVPRSQLIER
jgi:hypothetical protein